MKFCFFFNLFEVNDKDTSFWCLYCWLWTNVTYCSDVSVDDIKQVNASWVMISLIFAKILNFFGKWPITLWEIFILKYSISVGIEDGFWEKTSIFALEIHTLTLFTAMSYFYTPWKRQKNPRFPAFILNTERYGVSLRI